MCYIAVITTSRNIRYNNDIVDSEQVFTDTKNPTYISRDVGNYGQILTILNKYLPGQIITKFSSLPKLKHPAHKVTNVKNKYL
jgi:hypothetical protein